MNPGILVLALTCTAMVGAVDTAAIQSKASESRIRTLVVTGRNNHNWQVSSRAFELILENSGKFTVDIAISPAQGGDMTVFKPEFDKYDLVLLDYNGDDWPVETNTAFLEYVADGGGVVVYHAANNAFPGWEAYNRITALGGWGGRNEAVGPYVYVADDEIVRDDSPGSAGSHGPEHEYILDAFDVDHPVTNGLPRRWRHAQDELYDSMRGPGNIGSLLYTAYSSPDKGGTGRREPLMFTVNYGNARIFHTMTGHAGRSLEDNPAMQCTGFQITLLRGAEWAATGKVTGKVPEDFPTEDRVSLRPEYKEASR